MGINGDAALRIDQKTYFLWDTHSSISSKRFWKISLTVESCFAIISLSQYEETVYQQNGF